MPLELLKAHQNLDCAVMELYGFSVKDMTEAACVAALMERYREMVEEKENATALFSERLRPAPKTTNNG